MPVFQTNAQMYDFKLLPAYATFLLQHHIDDYTKESLRIAYELDVPLLKYLRHLPEAELFQLSRNTNIEFLTYLSENRIKVQIEESLTRWLNNQLPVVDKYDVDARDITLISYMRARLLKQWMKEFHPDTDVILKLNAEIDMLKLGQNTTFANTYMQILKERIEEELHFSQNVINASPGITYIFDLSEQKIIYINGKLQEVMGYTTQEVLAIGSNIITSLAYAKDQPQIFQFLDELANDGEGKTYQAEFRIKNKKGRYHWLRTYGVVYKRDAAGRAVQILGSGFEISNEKEIASALMIREKQLLEAQAIGHIGSFEWDLINDTSESTPEMRNIFEAETRQTLDEIMEKVHPDDKEKVRLALQEAFTTGIYTCEYRYMAKSREKAIYTKGVVTYKEDGRPAYMTGTVQDISERKRIEDSLIKKTLALERSNVQLQEFASIASHDLKEPLRKISTFADLITISEGDALSEKTKNNLKKITDAAFRMQQLIEGILSYSSVGSETSKEKRSLEELLQEVLANLENRIKDANATIKSDGLPQMAVIPFQMQQLFQNLISNALKFSKKEEAPLIKVTHAFIPATAVNTKNLQPARRYLQIHISDNGIGFSMDASEKIFGLFQRLHGKSAYEGSGLGLAICRKIAENHGGAITVVSTPNVGSTFTITLPA